MGALVVEQRHPVGIVRRHAPPTAPLEAAVAFERPHGAYPHLLSTVNEAAIDPARHTIKLKKKRILQLEPSFKPIAEDSNYVLTCSLGMLGLCPVLWS